MERMGKRGGLVLGAAALLAGCAGGQTGGVPIACPTPAILADAADLTRHRPGPVRDLTTLEFDARLAGLRGGCRAGRRDRAVEMDLSPSFTVERGAAAQGRVVDLPWTVAVVDDRTEEPIGRPQRFVERVVFGPNQIRAEIEGRRVTITLPATGERRVQDYRVLVFFQLTEEELALNRRRGPR